MAATTVPFKAPAKKPDQDVDDQLLKRMNALVTRARTDRARHQPRIADCYRYVMPWRHTFHANQPNPSEQDEIFDETPGTVLEDFSADMLNTFTPQKNNWLSEEPTRKFVNKGEEAGIKAQLKDVLEQRQAVIFAEMARSNLYQALQEAYLDLGPGTMCILIPPDERPEDPIRCEAIPITELLITRGPDGLVDGKFREKRYLREDAEYLWPEGKWTEQLGPKPPTGSEQEIDVVDGCWRDWSDRGNETYHYMVQCNGKRIYHKEYKGAGSCPFIVARWSRDSTTAWGFGPTYRALPAIKTLNRVRYLALKNYDKHVDPPFSYEDDGVFNFDHGMNPGDAIPRAVGSDAPEPIESKTRFDVQVFETDELRSIIKRAHYQDRPEQLGKTPPTATQWIDEAAERARRMGTPATNLVIELQIPIYARFSYILSQRGTLPAVKLNDENVAVVPISPLLRAQEQEEIVRMDRYVGSLNASFGPAITNIIVDQFKHAEDLATLIGYDKKRLRKKGEIAAAIAQFSGLLQQGNAPTAAPGEPPPLGAIT